MGGCVSIRQRKQGQEAHNFHIDVVASGLSLPPIDTPNGVSRRWIHPRVYPGSKTMRRTRWLFLAAILGIMLSVGATYFKYKEAEAKNAPAPPKAIASTLDAQSQDWTYTKSSGTQQQFFVRAHTMRKRNDASVIELEDVELHMFHKDGATYDLVRCAAANFD